MTATDLISENYTSDHYFEKYDTFNSSADIFEDSNVSSNSIEVPASTSTVILLSLLFCIIDTIGLIGNFLVIIVILLDRKMRRSVTNIFIMNLAVADFVIMLLGVAEIVQFVINRGWLLGPELCKIVRFILVTSLYGSILSLVSVCIERFIAIVYPLKAHILCGRKKIFVTVIAIWSVSIMFGLPTVIYNHLANPHPGVTFKHCIIEFPERELGHVFEFIQFVLFYLIPAVVQVTLYAVIGSKLYASTQELNTRFQMRTDKRVKHNKTTDTMKARKGVVKMLASSVLVYIICYAPPQFLLFYNVISRDSFQVTWSYRVFSIVISNINSAANPILYSIFSQNFRKNFKKYLYCLCYLVTRSDHRQTGQESVGSRIHSRNVGSVTQTTMYSKV